MKNILQVWPHFTCKKTLENGKIFSKKVFYFKTNGVLHMIALTNKKNKYVYASRTIKFNASMSLTLNNDKKNYNLLHLKKLYLSFIHD